MKKQRKQILADYIREHNHIDVDVNSIFDVQVKRLHAYKRQLLNILHVMYIYREMKENPDIVFIHALLSLERKQRLLTTLRKRSLS